MRLYLLLLRTLMTALRKHRVLHVRAVCFTRELRRDLNGDDAARPVFYQVPVVASEKPLFQDDS